MIVVDMKERIMQSCKFEHEKEIAKEIVRNKLVEFDYVITSEKSINNNLGYKFCGNEFAIIIYFKNDKSSKLVFEKASEEIVSLFQQYYDNEKVDNESKEIIVPINTSIKIEDKSKIEILKNHLLDSFSNVSIVENQPPICYRLKIQNADDKFTLTQYETGTLLLQGQATKLFSDILDVIRSINPLSDIENTLLYVPAENQEQVKNIFEEKKSGFGEIYSLAQKRISSQAFSYLFKNDQQTLVSAIGVLELVRANSLTIPLYNTILYPFAIVFEGFVIRLLIDKAFFTFEEYKANPEVADIGNALRKKKLKKYIKDTRRNEFVLDKLITTWESLRCHELHSDPAQEENIVNLTDIDQVDNRIGEISGTIIDAYRIIVENGYTEEEMIKNREQQKT